MSRITYYKHNVVSNNRYHQKQHKTKLLEEMLFSKLEIYKYTWTYYAKKAHGNHFKKGTVKESVRRVITCQSYDNLSTKSIVIVC